MWLSFLVSMSIRIVIIGVINFFFFFFFFLLLLLGCGEDGRAADNMGLPKYYTALGHSLRRPPQNEYPVLVFQYAFGMIPIGLFQMYIVTPIQGRDHYKWHITNWKFYF